MQDQIFIPIPFPGLVPASRQNSGWERRKGEKSQRRGDEEREVGGGEEKDEGGREKITY